MLSFISLNARGLRNSVKRKALFLFAKQFKSDFVYFQESHSNEDDSNFWRSQWGNTIWLSHGTERSAGVASLNNRFNGNVLTTQCDPDGHFICQVIEHNDSIYLVSNIYGYNTKKENVNLLLSIENIFTGWLVRFPNALILLGGDFNIILDGSIDKSPPSQRNNSDSYLTDFIRRFKLIDIWREKNPNSRLYTWSNKSGSRQSRLDYWLISDSLNKDYVDVSICPTPLTDHKAICISLNISAGSTLTTHSSYWKLNCSALQNGIVQYKIKDMISLYWSKANKENCFGLNWDLLKYEIGKYLRKFGAETVKARKAEELKIVSNITNLSCREFDSLTKEEKEGLSYSQIKLDEMYRQKAKGAFIRSRSKWLEEGEQNSRYFFSLEKYRSTNNSISKLNVNGAITEDHRKISEFCSKFYKDLYSSRYSPTASDNFLNSLSVKIISEVDREHCDMPLSLEEVQQAVNQLKNNKSPGCDGLSSEFYKSFIAELSPFLLKVFLESIENECLPTSLTQGITVLIPKPNKDKLFLDNWRPICLLNNDYKILALLLARRLRSVLDSIIDETQSGFMNKRHIGNNIRLILDILDYPEMVEEGGLMLFVDFYKAFDTVEHPFILQSLKKFGFGDFFSSAIKSLYNNSNSSIRLPGGMSPRFNVSRGIRQGCPASPYLFLLVAQLLSDHIKSSEINGINICGRELIISQLADDTTLFLRDENQVSGAINTIEKFSMASGLRLNINKCEIMSIKDCLKSSICNIPVKSELVHLGITITKDQQKRTLLNFNPIIQRTRKKLNQWLLRDLSLRGRTLLSKTEGLSRLTYPALSLYVDKKHITEIDKLLFNFLWKNRTHHVKKSVLTNDYEKGGLNFIDFCTLNNTFKVNWLKHFFKNPNSIWNVIPCHILSKLGGLSYFLTCNYNIDKVPIKMASFHRQAFLSWSLIFKHNFSPNKYYIWNNKDILFKHKSLFIDYWFNNNIIFVDQLFNRDGCLYSYNEFLEEYKIPVSPGDYAKVFGAISSGVCMLYRAQPRLDTQQLTLLSLTDTSVGKICFSCNNGKNNKLIRSLFKKDIITVPYVVPYWNKFVQNIDWKKVWLLPNRYLLTNKIREISFKIIHKFYPSNDHIVKKFKKDIDVMCTFCSMSIETVTHLFWHCPFVQSFWSDICNFIAEKIEKDFKLFWKDVLFGLYDLNRTKTRPNETFIINLIILLAKFYIHKCKFAHSKTSFIAFNIEVKQYVNTIKYSLNQKATKTVKVCKQFDIFL